MMLVEKSAISASRRVSYCISIRKGLTDSRCIYQDLKLSTRIRGCSSLCCTNQASVGALLLGWCT